MKWIIVIERWKARRKWRLKFQKLGQIFFSSYTSRMCERSAQTEIRRSYLLEKKGSFSHAIHKSYQIMYWLLSFQETCKWNRVTLIYVYISICNTWGLLTKDLNLHGNWCLRAEKQMFHYTTCSTDQHFWWS